MKKLLSEITGMTLGDGEIFDCPRCQRLRIYCHIKETNYLKHIKFILQRYFDKTPYIYFQPYKGECYAEINKKGLSDLLKIKAGGKIKNKVRIPYWIFKNKIYLKNCLRGLFDIDGCCYLTGGKYQIINFCSKNSYLLKDVFRVLTKLGYHPYKREKDVELGRQKEVLRFFEEIKPKNKKHYRYQNAGVANLVKARL